MKRSFSPLEDQILSIVEPVATETGFDIVRVRITGGENKKLQIMAERQSDGSMNVDDCISLSNELSVHLDIHDLIDQHYVLEVSSPGIDRPLVSRHDFKKFEGFVVKLELLQAVEGRKRFSGEIVEAHEDYVDIALNDDKEDMVVEFQYNQLWKAQLVMNDHLMQSTAPDKT